MKRLLDLPAVRWLLVIAFGGAVVLLTTASGRFFVLQVYQRVVGFAPITDALLHGVLFGALTALLHWVLRRRLNFGRSFLLALGVGLFVSAVTEISQDWTPGRTLALSDFLANWLGVFVAATIVLYRRL